MGCCYCGCRHSPPESSGSSDVDLSAYSQVLTTRTKIGVARWLSRVLVGLRQVIGLGSEVEARRRGIRWKLDLREGIDLAIYLGLYEKWLERIATRYLGPGGVAIDIGANIGAHTLLFARLVGSDGLALAIEPTDYAFDKLKTNLGLNPLLARRVEIHQVFLVSDSRDPIPGGVYSSWPVSDVDDFIHPTLMGRRMETTRARGRSLDDLIGSTTKQGDELGRIDFVKIDVDGHELTVLEGAINTIRKFRPPLLIEFAPHLQTDADEWATAWIELLGRLEYELRDPRDNGAIEMNEETIKHLAPHGASVDLVALPIGPVPTK